MFFKGIGTNYHVFEVTKMSMFRMRSDQSSFCWIVIEHQLIIIHSQCQGLQIHTYNQNLSFREKKKLQRKFSTDRNDVILIFKLFLSKSKWSPFQGPDVQIELGGQMLNI